MHRHGLVIHTPFLLPEVPRYLLTVAGLLVTQTAVLVEEPTGHIGMVDDGDVAS